MAGQPKTRAKKKQDYRAKRKAAEIEAKQLIERSAKELQKSNGPGHPTIFTEQLWDDYLENIRNGMSLRKASAKKGMPGVTTVREWLRDDREKALQYARAREDQADFYADRLVEIAENVTANRDDVEKAKLLSDNIKWVASKLKPKKYGDKLDLTSDGEQLPVPITALQVNMPGEARQLPAANNKQ